MKLQHLLFALAASLLATSAFAADASKDYAKLGEKIWPAFTCAAAAAQSSNRDEQARLFLVGYESGKKFLAALADGKIEEFDVQSSVAIAVTMRLRGPSADFILGTIWEGAVDDFYKKAKERCSDCAAMTATAEQAFRQMNCSLIK